MTSFSNYAYYYKNRVETTFDKYLVIYYLFTFIITLYTNNYLTGKYYVHKISK